MFGALLAWHLRLQVHARGSQPRARAPLSVTASRASVLVVIADPDSGQHASHGSARSCLGTPGENRSSSSALGAERPGLLAGAGLPHPSGACSAGTAPTHPTSFQEASYGQAVRKYQGVVRRPGRRSGASSSGNSRRGANPRSPRRRPAGPAQRSDRQHRRRPGRSRFRPVEHAASRPGLQHARRHRDHRRRHDYRALGTGITGQPRSQHSGGGRLSWHHRRRSCLAGQPGAGRGGQGRYPDPGHRRSARYRGAARPRRLRRRHADQRPVRSWPVPAPGGRATAVAPPAASPHVEYPHATASINGYTDSLPAPGGNLLLSQRRARAVEKWLTAHRVAVGPTAGLRLRRYRPGRCPISLKASRSTGAWSSSSTRRCRARPITAKRGPG